MYYFASDMHLGSGAHANPREKERAVVEPSSLWVMSSTFGMSTKGLFLRALHDFLASCPNSPTEVWRFTFL